MSVLEPDEIAGLGASIGASRTVTQFIDAASAARFDAAVGAASPSPLGHWAYFNDIAADDRLGPDGHPRRGDFLPAIAKLPRRMFAASVLSFAAPLVVGTEATMNARITDVRHKRGGSGDLVFVEIERTIVQGGKTRITERQTLVYRSGGDGAMVVPLPEIAEPGLDAWVATTVNLFRFSAATFNGHRIHYDRAYALEVEHYPGLVVHGPLIAARLAELAARRAPLAAFEFRALLPCFVDCPIRLVEADTNVFNAVRNDGRVAMTAQAVYR